MKLNDIQVPCILQVHILARLRPRHGYYIALRPGSASKTDSRVGALDSCTLVPGAPDGRTLHTNSCEIAPGGCHLGKNVRLSWRCMEVWHPQTCCSMSKCGLYQFCRRRPELVNGPRLVPAPPWWTFSSSMVQGLLLNAVRKRKEM